MNVGFVVHDYDRREGHGRYAVELVARIAAEHQVTLYASAVHDDPPDTVRVVRVPALRSRSYAKILSFPLAFAAVRRPHDLVHAQGWSAPRADVCTAHIVLRAWLAAVRRGNLPPGRGERLFGRYVAAREAATYRRARAVIAPSGRVKRDVQQLVGRTRNVVVIPHGFPSPAAFDRRDARAGFGLPQDAVVALYAGDARKGLTTALRALADAAAVHLLVVSRSPLGPWQAQARDSAVLERVWWVRGVPAIEEAYAAADILLHPTIYDAFGMVVSEAMAHGVVPVVSREAGIVDFVRDGENGLLVDPADAHGVAAALRRLAGDAAQRDRMASEARATAASRTWDDVALETLRVYRDVGETS